MFSPTGSVTSNETLLDSIYSTSMDRENLSQEWLLMGSPVPVMTLISLYLLIVLKLGPEYMKDKAPYTLKTVMRIYNIAQVLYNAAILYIFLTPVGEVFLPILHLIRNSCTTPQEFGKFNEFPLRYLYISISWYFLGLKTLDLLDTFFMILRKKTSHITLLHVYHHSSTVFFVWFSFKYIKPIQGAIPVFLNLIVHTFMYTYYFMATFNSFKKYLWWKKHLTKLQVTQLILVIAYLSSLYYNQCPVSRLFTYIWLVNVLLNLILFLNFYVRAYIFTPNKKQNVNKTK